jgi:hypothetical protein
MKRLLIFALLLCGSTALAQVNGMTGLCTTHPRLLGLCDAAKQTQAQNWVAANPWTPTTDTNWPDSYAELAFHGWATSTASECATAIAYLTGFSCGDCGSNGSNDMRNNAEASAFVYDLCYAQLSSGQKSTLHTNWVNWLTLQKNDGWGGVGMQESNYYWGTFRDDFNWGLLFYNDFPSDSTTFLNDGLVTRWANDFIPHAAGDGKGGMPQEGTEYGAYEIGYPVVPLWTSGLYNRDLTSETNFHKEMLFYIIYSMTQAASASGEFQLFPFDDVQDWTASGNIGRGSHSYQFYDLQDFMLWAANKWGSVDAGKYARQWISLTGLTTRKTTAWLDAGGTTKAFTNLPLDYYAAGPGQFFGRKAWGAANSQFHIQLGQWTGIGHMHMDFGSWSLWRNSRWLTRETVDYSDTYPGYAGSGTASSYDTVLHNTILVNRAGMYWDWADMGNAAPLRVQSASGYSYAATNISQSYLSQSNVCAGGSNPSVNTVIREFVYVRALETMVILDRVKSANAYALCGSGPTDTAAIKSYIQHCETNPTKTSDTEYTCTNGTQVLHTSILVPASPGRSAVINEGSPNGQYRIEVETSGVAQSYFLTAHQARSTSDSNLTASVVDSNPGSPTSGTFTVTLHPAAGADTIIVFNKGQTSSGGTIDIAGAGAASLGANVQGLTVGDTGPVWEGMATNGRSVSGGYNLSGGKMGR